MFTLNRTDGINSGLELILYSQYTMPFLLSTGAIMAISAYYMLSRNGGNKIESYERADINIPPQQSQRENSSTEQTLQSIISATNEGFWVINPKTGTIQDTNDALCNMLEYTREEIIGKLPLDFAENRKKGIMRYRMENVGVSNHHNYETELKTKSGKTLYVQIKSKSIPNKISPHKAALNIAFVTDISDRKHHEDELYRLAHYDSITSLPNRHYLVRYINALTESEKPFGMLLLDLDNFKHYNDILGHTLGDRALKKIADRLKTEFPGNFVARLGGDEFMIVSTQDRAIVLEAGKQCNSLLSEQKIGKDINLHGGASIGAVFYPKDGCNVNDLLKNANLAMYKAKSLGKGCMCEYTPSLDQDLRSKLDLVDKLRSALQQNEFELHYQPQTCATTGDIVGVEALLRWNRPDDCMVSPEHFIPALEESGLIVPVGKWVIETACTQSKNWYSSNRPVRLSVNLSSVQIQEPDFANTIKQILQTTGFDASRLVLEITESLLVDNIPLVTKRLQSVTDQGVSFSIDDFGTGYSSLSYLQKFPISELKIDRAFVQNLGKNNGDLMIIQAIVAMAAALGMETVAEGVEKREQLLELEKIGVRLIQGYLTGRPVSGEDMSSRLEGKVKTNAQYS